MKFKMLFSVFGVFLFASASFAGSPMDKYLSNIKVFDNEDGRYFETFEDVDLNFNPFQKRNKPYPIVNKSTIPEGKVYEETAQKYFKDFSSHAVLTEEEISFKDFMNEHFSLSYRENDTEIYRLVNFPLNQYINTPGTSTFYLCMDSNYEYVKKFKPFKPDYANALKPVYSNFKEKLLSNSTIVEAEEIDNDKNFISVFCKDRTPPIITFQDTANTSGYDGNTPNAKRSICTTSDWYEMPGVTIKDNYAKELFGRYSFGKINECLIDGEVWADKEHWDYPENIQRVVKDIFTDVVAFYPIDGFIRYSIFAKEGSPEGKGNLNPSIGKIVEDSPETCYGYKGETSDEYIDLGNTPSTAKDWIDKRPLTEVAEKGKEAKYLRILDNDAPNIIIRVTNVETGEQMFFPPCLATGCLRINNSTLYKSLRGVSNEDEYNTFVENLGSAYDYKSLMKEPALRPYYTIYSIDDKTIKTEKVDNYIRKLLLNNDLEFINQNVRVEDHFYSDTNSDGTRTNTIQRIGELGRRNGTFVDMIALFENNGNFVFKTDVEYKLDVFIDDNVKWTNLDKEKGNGAELDSLSSTAKVYYTGISKGIIRLDIPNQKDEEEQENLSQEKNIEINRAINGDIHFKLRKATPYVYDFKVPRDIEKEKFPSISVDVEDYSELRRRIKLFFRVKDKNIGVRILENNKKSNN
ncbi:MAG: hypothetical protein II567_00600 [Candidatus Riflebacteria bacterium]|nr:hypothetical protein [Candidatus Riflebacteria bacterium]